MNYLAIDTSTSRASVALSVHGHISHAEQGQIREHAQHLLPMVQQLLLEGGISLSELDGIVCGRGPGSFTGLRIACSIVKGLSYPHDIPIYPVSSLTAIAEEVFYTQPEAKGVLAIIDARMQEVYWNYYLPQPREDVPFEKLSYRAQLEEQVGPLTSISLTPSNAIILAGVGWENYANDLSPSLQKQCMQRSEIYPDARAMIRIVEKGGSMAMSADEILPVYIRNRVT